MSAAQQVQDNVTVKVAETHKGGSTKLSHGAYGCLVAVHLHPPVSTAEVAHTPIHTCQLATLKYSKVN